MLTDVTVSDVAGGDSSVAPEMGSGQAVSRVVAFPSVSGVSQSLFQSEHPAALKSLSLIVIISSIFKRDGEDGRNLPPSSMLSSNSSSRSIT